MKVRMTAVLAVVALAIPMLGGCAPRVWGKPERQADNLKAGYGPLLTAAQRKELVALVG